CTIGLQNRRNQLCRVSFCIANRYRHRIELPEKHSTSKPIRNSNLFIHQSISKMKFTINKISLLATIVVLVFAFSACSNHKEGDGHDHGTKEEPKKEEAHEEETPTIATLTEEQIKTVGIQLGTVEQKEL